MIPIFRQSDIKAFDESLAAQGLLEEAIARAGYSVFALASELLDGLYGKKVTVIFGPGNNGKDALVAAGRLRWGGAVVNEVRYGSEEYFDEASYSEVDLVIDGCFGVGLSRAFEPPPIGPETEVLAVDVPSGLDGDHGSVLGSAVRANSTLCLSGLKLGPLISEGPEFCGEIYVSELGLGDLGLPGSREFLIEDDDLALLAFGRKRRDYKWSHSIAVVAGSPGMDGAAHLVCTSGYYVGAGIIHLYTNRAGQAGDYGVETVVHSVALSDLDQDGKREFFQGLAERFKALVIGPGLGRGEEVAGVVKAAIESRLRTVIDADAISAIPSVDWLSRLIGVGHPGIILTPHTGELKGLLERSGGMFFSDYLNKDLCSFARKFASETGAALLVKGGPTVVASPDGSCYLTTAPDVSLAVAGSGDVLSGMIGAALSYEGDIAELAAVTAHLHGLAGRSLSKGPSGELATWAREILLHLEDCAGPAFERNFFKPTPIDGNLVAKPYLLRDRSRRLV